MSREALEARWEADPDLVFRLAREIAKEALGIGWYDTESAARAVALHAAEREIAATAARGAT